MFAMSTLGLFIKSVVVLVHWWRPFVSFYRGVFCADLIFSADLVRRHHQVNSIIYQ